VVKRISRNQSRFRKEVAVSALYLFLCAAPGLTQTQSSQPSPEPIAHNTASVTRPKKAASVTRSRKATRSEDDLTGLTLTDDQKTKIEEIRQDMKPRMEEVVNDANSSPEQKGAMLEGLVRMERRQVFEILTPEQRSEVRERILAEQAAKQEANKKTQQSLPQ
jgi:Spy/CpxP family protein refolding chaperone